ncbi:hypothetical protein QBC33DRAFT_560347 [Phialemonium atrogriseum]|uniref:CsbD-like domain-containing protein n=1 Tax=Phialemonium atrogriseum TaxID=1093897 RepID=A0AAJ0BX41_9PEZI|nr:uncharacterized protein QBC33DRAFT_560347 [Phialemonium atrogriseum]KAK1765910.1 hypothetical protein QBC33DRAFT_560347 [Phialemonium atrogriseum]
MSSNNNAHQQQPNQPGLIGGHAEYIKGVAESTVGSVTGSHAWTTSGEQDKAHAQASLRAATENRDPAASGYGKAEEVAGRLTGCEGMKKEGAASRNKRSS